ncbi:thermonuclease family protein [Calothrix sp. PCC 6303]|uniref:thermonuclease family protein n=1 Tax=Calothrix sp. PCC 6303 TaxID=1170562 RepID=UPI0002A02477|nr:thermonuclease family protein [Calothrix sp. PCC 6303]AFZ03109.1 nuclease (SNase domain-containing protein) [Calothrix sp. PCC 6303]
MELLEFILMLATVTGIINGEIIAIKDNTGQVGQVKLTCINPQPNLAAPRLKELLPADSPVVIRSIEKDQSGRIVGEVYVDNRSINLRLVEEGNAVVNRETLNNCSENKIQYLIAEANAKNKQLGLWQQSKVHSLQGKLIYQEITPVMSTRSYRGEEFFLVTNFPEKNRLVLLPSAQVSRTQLQALHNQQVEIKAVYIEGIKPDSAGVACPIDADGKCMPQGGGYQVLSVSRSPVK